MDLFTRMPARDPRESLRLIAGHVQKYEFSEAEMPEVTVFLGSGGSVSGKVVRCDPGRETDYVLLKQGDDSDPQLTTLRLCDVTALKIHRASAVAAIFSANTVARPGSAPTKLQLMREFEKAREELHALRKEITLDYQWPNTEMPDEVRFNISDLAQTIVGALKKIAAEPQGSEALSAVAGIRMRHEPGSAFQVTRNEATVELTCDLRRPLPVDVDAQLKKDIESVL